jgi:hypothetical protein
MNTLFELGRCVMTRDAAELLLHYDLLPDSLLGRHAAGDWGAVPEEDKKLNDQAVEDGYRIVSAYQLSELDRIWIITEGDRSVTTLLLPEEY